jgi:hypothetical protein
MGNSGPERGCDTSILKTGRFPCYRDHLHGLMARDEPHSATIGSDLVHWHIASDCP